MKETFNFTPKLMMNTMRILSLIFLSLFFIQCSSDDNSNNNNNNDPNDPNPTNLPKLVAFEVGPNGTNVQYEYNDNDLLEVWTETTQPGVGFEITTAYNDELNPNVWYYVDSDGVSDQKGFFYDFQGRVFRYLDAQDDVTLIYDNDTVLFEGIIDEVADVSGSMTLNAAGKVTRFNGPNQYLTFDYDTSGNMIALNQYDNNDNLINNYSFTYDNKNNPFYGQFDALYLVRTIDLFWDFSNINFTGFSGYVYPYNPNNMTAILLDGITMVNYLIGYDNDDYPAVISEAISGNSYQWDIIYITE